MPNFSLDQLAECARREVSQRKWVYSRIIDRDPSKTDELVKELRMMEAIHQLLEGMATEQPDLFDMVEQEASE